jgi:hypothetical protein
MARPRIAVACRWRAEHQSLTEWLQEAGFEPMPIVDVGSLRDRDALPFELLIADVDYSAADVLPQILRGVKRPVIVVGDRDAGARRDAEARDCTYMERPLDRNGVMFMVSLVLVEGRPLRRSPRKVVPRLPATIDGVSSRVIDVSYEGLRLELSNIERSSLPPFFTLRVPVFGVAALTVQRVWVAAPGKGVLWCGGTFVKNPERAAKAWRTVVESAPISNKFSYV